MSRSIIITLLVACVRVRGEKDKREKAGCVFLERERGGIRRIVCGLVWGMEGLGMLKQLIGQLQQLLDTYQSQSHSSSTLILQPPHTLLFQQQHPRSSFSLLDLFIHFFLPPFPYCLSFK